MITLLRGRGFFPAVFEPFKQWDPRPVGIGWRGTGFNVHGDILFFRDIKHVIEHAQDPFTTLLKLGFIALSFEKIAFALECLTEAFKNPDAEILALGDELRYIRFLDELYTVYRNSSQIFPLRFPHWYTEEQSKGRFDIKTEKKHSLSDRAVKLQAIKAYSQETDASMFVRVAPGLRVDEPTAFETFLRDHTFLELADKVATERKYLALRIPTRLI